MNTNTAFGTAITAILIFFLTTFAVGSLQIFNSTQSPANSAVVADGSGGGLEWG